MKRNYFLVLVCIFLASCSHRLIPNNRQNAMKSPYGAYMELTAYDGQYTGEFIGYTNDSVFLLTDSHMILRHQDEILSFDLVLVENKSRRYLVSTGIMMTPYLVGAAAHSDYSAEFLTAAGVAGLIGGVATLIEAGRKPDIIQYPEDHDEISAFLKFARFPAAMPAPGELKVLTTPDVIANKN